MADEMQTLNFDFKTTGITEATKNVKGLESAFDKLFTRMQNLSKLDMKAVSSFSTRTGTLVKRINELSGVDATGFSNALKAVSKLPKMVESIGNVDTAKLDKFKKIIKDITVTVTPLNANMSNIASGFKELKSTIPGVTQKIEQFENANKNLEKKSGSIKDTLSKIKTWWVAVAMAIRKAISGIGKSYNEFADYIEAINLYKSTMGSAATGEISFAKQVESELGIDIKQWMTMQGTVQQMARGFGVSNEMATKMSRNLTQLAYDISSIYNEDVEESMQKINSAMTGQVKGIREYGIETTVAALQEFALSKGIDKSVSSMTMAEKAWLRYELIMERTQNLQGNLGKELLSPANSMRVLNNQITILKRNFGAIVSVVATKIIPYFQVFIEYIADAAEVIASMFGVSLEEYFASVGDVNIEFAKRIDETNKEAEKLKKTLMGFDEINTVGSNNAAGGLFSDDSWIYNQSLYEYNILDSITKEIDEKVKKIKQDLADLGLDKIGDIIIDIAGALKGIYESPLIQYLVDAGLYSSLSGIEHVLGAVRDILMYIEDKLDFDWMDILGFTDIVMLLKTLERTILGIGNIFASVFGLDGLKKRIQERIDVLNSTDTAKDYLATFLGKETADKMWDTTNPNATSRPYTQEMGLQTIPIVTVDYDTGKKTTQYVNGKVPVYKIEEAIDPIKIAEDSAFMASSVTKAIENIDNAWSTSFKNIDEHLASNDSLAKFLISTGGGVGYANGGYPDQGELFFANETGPELVGRIGGRTAVASNNDILESMYRVMRDAMSASGGKGGNATVNLNVDGQTVAQVVYDAHNNTVRQTGHSPLLI